MNSRRPWRVTLAVVAVRVVNGLSRRVGRGAGTVAGGRVGLAIAPRLLREMSEQRMIVLVTGTNGKTTTSAMIRVGWGGQVAANDTGANMPAGHVAALCASAAPHVVLETDEAWLATVVEATAPRVVVLLNLSRDQLDRANEVRRLAQRWRECVAEEVFSGVVVANAADPLVVYAAESARHVRWVEVPSPWRDDAASCPHCTRAIEFREGGWACSCGFAQPERVDAVLGSDLRFEGETYELDLALPGRFNEVNAALALISLDQCGESITTALERLRTMTSVQGRYGRRRFARRTLRLLLAKNPAGTAALLQSLGPDDEIWIAINAQVADGRDPSWLYDVPFEGLRGRRVVCLGERRLDLATRLSYAGVDCEVGDDLEELRRGEGDVTLVANYTAFREWMGRTTPC